MTSMAMSSYQMVNLANAMLCWDLVILYIIYDMTLYDHIMDPNGDCVWFMMLFSPDGLISNDPIGI